MILDMKIYIQIMIKGLNSAEIFKSMLPLSFNMLTVYPSCIAHTVLYLGLQNNQQPKTGTQKPFLDGFHYKLYSFWVLVKFIEVQFLLLLILIFFLEIILSSQITLHKYLKFKLIRATLKTDNGKRKSKILKGQTRLIKMANRKENIPQWYGYCISDVQKNGKGLGRNSKISDVPEVILNPNATGVKA